MRRRRQASQSDEEESQEEDQRSEGSVDPFSEEEEGEDRESEGDEELVQKTSTVTLETNQSQGNASQTPPTNNENTNGTQNASEKQESRASGSQQKRGGRYRKRNENRGKKEQDWNNEKYNQPRRRRNRNNYEEQTGYGEGQQSEGRKGGNRNERSKQGKTKLVYQPKGSSTQATANQQPQDSSQESVAPPQSVSQESVVSEAAVSQPVNTETTNQTRNSEFSFSQKKQNRPREFRVQPGNATSRRTVRYSSKHQEESQEAPTNNTPLENTSKQNNDFSSRRDRSKSFDNNHYNKRGEYRSYNNNNNNGSVPHDRHNKPKQTYVPKSDKNSSQNNNQQSNQKLSPPTKDFNVVASTPPFPGSMQGVYSMAQYQYLTPGMYPYMYPPNYSPYLVQGMSQDVFYPYTLPNYQTQKPVEEQLPPRRSHAIPITAPPKSENAPNQ